MRIKIALLIIFIYILLFLESVFNLIFRLFSLSLVKKERK